MLFVKFFILYLSNEYPWVNWAINVYTCWWTVFLYSLGPVNTWRPPQNGGDFTDDVFKCIFLNENVWILLKISLKFVPKVPINNMPAFVQIIAGRRPGDKPLSEPMMVNLLTHISITQPQWVKEWSSGDWIFESGILDRISESQPCDWMRGVIQPSVLWIRPAHYIDVIMSAMTSQITGVSIVYSTVWSGVDQRKHQSSTSLAFVMGIHQWPGNSPHQAPVTRKMIPFDDVIICETRGTYIFKMPRQVKLLARYINFVIFSTKFCVT